jgi:hypothetical protein
MLRTSMSRAAVADDHAAPIADPYHREGRKATLLPVANDGNVVAGIL